MGFPQFALLPQPSFCQRLFAPIRQAVGCRCHGLPALSLICLLALNFDLSFSSSFQCQHIIGHSPLHKLCISAALHRVDGRCIAEAQKGLFWWQLGEISHWCLRGCFRLVKTGSSLSLLPLEWLRLFMLILICSLSQVYFHDIPVGQFMVHLELLARELG